MENFEFYSLIIAGAALSVGFGAVIFTGLQFKRSADIHNSNLLWSKRLETRKKLDNGNKEATIILNEKFEFLMRKQPIPIEEILKAIKADHTMLIHINSLLNLYEGLAGGIKAQIYDEGVVKLARRGAMIRNYYAFMNYIEHQRREGRPKAYVEYKNLVKKWLSEDESTESFRSPDIV